MTAVHLELRGIHQRYPGAVAPTLSGLDLDLPAGTATALLGPSGCGKSTLLSILAGLRSAEGTVLLDGIDITGVAAERRDAGVVFQQPLLFPHLNVADNVAFGLRRRGIGTSAARRRAAELLELVDLADAGARRPAELSGGQAQRVALARALAPAPRMLLLDEPLSALDPAIRTRMRDLIRRIQRDLRITTVFVTHDQLEAAEIADRTALLLDGRIAQAGTAADLHLRPVSATVARFMGPALLVPGRNDDGVFTGSLGAVPVPPGAPRGDVLLVVRDTAVQHDPHGDRTATVTAVHDLGSAIRVRLRAADGRELTTTVRPGAELPGVGAAMTYRLGPHALWTVPAEHGAPSDTSHLEPALIEHSSGRRS
ncbi:ABC transporter ATP-binding protein [Amycolatopsis sp. H20-H5]|uniref:ABC transporter ATP-binding protein n=1 Tax=Amycolatopsis sp. H20-H5 TaxID=3046309 RepID=UPI002DB5A591|nr:ABC transporter ATP-binding protein [Amycolatopsis sp. H20-H5]MEC3975841.1 ABC transporter ATP-binding protein [Amycolatopsis sp. H20-H5]